MGNESKFILSFKSKIKIIIEKNEVSRLEPIIYQFWKDVSDNDYPIIEELDQTENSGDLHEYNLVTFLYRSNEILDNVFLLAEFNYIDARDYVFEKIEKTDIYYKTFALPKNTQATYRIMINDPLDGIFAGTKYANRMSKFGDHPDRLNRNIQRIKDGFVLGKDLLVAWLKSPNDQNKFIIENDNSQILNGKLIDHSHSSNIFGYSRKITVYTPKNYDSNKKYPYLIMFDGSSSIKYIQIHMIIEKMIEEGQIPPIIVIFVEPGIKNDQTMRYEEYPCNPDFSKSITEEILPWIKENYSITDNPQKAIIAGSSYGGLAAFYYSFMYPDKIANIISLSGSFHVGKNDDGAYPYDFNPSNGNLQRYPPFDIRVALYRPNFKQYSGDRSVRKAVGWSTTKHHIYRWSRGISVSNRGYWYVILNAKNQRIAREYFNSAGLIRYSLAISTIINIGTLSDDPYTDVKEKINEEIDENVISELNNIISGITETESISSETIIAEEII